MNCHYCGAETGPNVVFCRNCGTRQKSTPQIEPAALSLELPPILPEPAAVPMPQPAPVLNEQTFTWAPQPEMQPAAPVAVADDEPLFDFEKAAASRAAAPMIQLPVKRSLVKMIFFSILTLGIYPFVIYSRLVTELNIAASRYDGKRTLSFFGMLMLAPVTLGILPLVWFHRLCGRIGCELQRRNILYTFGARDFWLWNMLLSLLCAATVGCLVLIFGMQDWIVLVSSLLSVASTVGPFIFVHKLMKSMNLINTDFNLNG